MVSGELYRFHGVISTEPTAAIMPPIRQEIFCGLTLEKSNAGETKLATMLMPTVAIMKVSAPRMTAYDVVQLGHGVHRVDDELAEHRPGRRGGDHDQQREDQEVDRQAQEVALA